jgi:hypothetical protein
MAVRIVRVANKRVSGTLSSTSRRYHANSFQPVCLHDAYSSSPLAVRLAAYATPRALPVLTERGRDLTRKQTKQHEEQTAEEVVVCPSLL